MSGQLTEAHYDWVYDLLGIDARGKPNGAAADRAVREATPGTALADAASGGGAPGGGAPGGGAPGAAPGHAAPGGGANGVSPNGAFPGGAAPNGALQGADAENEPPPAHGLSYEQPAEGGLPDHMEKFDTKNAIPIKSERLAALDKDLSSTMTGLIEKAIAAAKAMKDTAGKAGVDLTKPAAAVAPLKAAAPKVNEQERRELKTASDALNAQKDALSSILIQLRDKSAELRRTLDHLMSAPRKVDFDPEKYEAPRDAAQKAVDGVVQFIKFISELANPSSAGLAFLELVGADVAKDGLKGGNSDEMVEALREGFDQLKDTVNDMINSLNVLSDAQKEQVKDVLTTLTSLRRAAEAAYKHFVTTQRHFEEALKDIAGKIEAAKRGKGGKAYPEAQKTLDVYRGVSEAAKARQLAIAAISASKGLSDLGFWMRNLVPLGELIFDGRDTSKARANSGSMILSVGTSMMVYQVGGKQIVFYLPSNGLDNSFEELSKWVGLAHKLTMKDEDGVEAASDNWTTAMVDGL